METVGEEEGSPISQGESRMNPRSLKGWKGNQRNPLCVGFSRALNQVPNYVVGESEMEASKEGRSLSDFKYACLGYSAYMENKNSPTDEQEGQAELPFCVGVEEVHNSLRKGSKKQLLLHTKNSDSSVNLLDTPILPRPPTYRPPHPIGDEFISRFYRNAGLVAGGVARNLYRVGNYIKDNLDDILYPYRRRPK